MNWQELISKLAFCTGLETSPRTTTTGKSSNATMTVWYAARGQPTAQRCENEWFVTIYSLLPAIVKYPCPFSALNRRGKLGFFNSECEVFWKVVDKLVVFLFVGLVLQWNEPVILWSTLRTHPVISSMKSWMSNVRTKLKLFHTERRRNYCSVSLIRWHAIICRNTSSTKVSPTVMNRLFIWGLICHRPHASNRNFRLNCINSPKSVVFCMFFCIFAAEIKSI